MYEVKLKFKTKEELINHKYFEYLYPHCIQINGINVHNNYLGNEYIARYDGNYIYIDEEPYNPNNLLVFANFELPKITYVNDEPIVHNENGSFTIGCTTISKVEMIPIVNYVLDCLGYEGIKG